MQKNFFGMPVQVAVAPCVLLLEVVILRRRFTAKHYASIAIVCLGVAVSTMQDLQVRSCLFGTQDSGCRVNVVPHGSRC